MSKRIKEHQYEDGLQECKNWLEDKYDGLTEYKKWNTRNTENCMIDMGIENEKNERNKCRV